MGHNKGNKGKKKEPKPKPKSKAEKQEKKDKKKQKQEEEEDTIDFSKEYPFALCGCVRDTNISGVKKAIEQGNFFKCVNCAQVKGLFASDDDKPKRKKTTEDESKQKMWLSNSSGLILCDNHAKTNPKLNAGIAMCINTLDSYCFKCHCPVGYTIEKHKNQNVDLSKPENDHAKLFKLLLLRLMQAVEKKSPSLYAHVEFVASLTEVGGEQKAVQKWAVDNEGRLKAMHGLYNLGNTCFFNSIMQNLSQTKPLVNYFIDFDKVFPDKKSEPKPFVKLFAGELTLQLLLHFNQYYSSQANILNPKLLFHSIVKLAPNFRGYGQHDAQELLRYLQMNARDEYVNEMKEKAKTDTNYKVDENDNIIDNTFRTVLTSTIVCNNCRNVSKRNEDCHDISIPMPRLLKKKGGEKPPSLKQRFEALHQLELETYKPNREDVLNPNDIMEQIRFNKRDEDNDDEITLMHCMWGFAAKEELTGDNGYICDKCSYPKEETEPTENAPKKKAILRDASKQMSISNPSKVLTIHLKRFVQKVRSTQSEKSNTKSKASLLNFVREGYGGTYVKDDTKVTFNTSLELNAFIHPGSTEKEKKYKYQLFGIVEHQGSMLGGHYIAYVKQLQVDKNGNNVRGDWHAISDSYHTKVPMHEVMSAEPYVLFYELVE